MYDASKVRYILPVRCFDIRHNETCHAKLSTTVHPRRALDTTQATVLPPASRPRSIRYIESSILRYIETFKTSTFWYIENFDTTSRTHLIRPRPPSHHLQAVHFTPSTTRATTSVAPPQNDSSWLPNVSHNQAKKRARKLQIFPIGPPVALDYVHSFISWFPLVFFFLGMFMSDHSWRSRSLHIVECKNDAK